MSRLDELIAEFCPDGVEYKEIDEVFELKNGYTPSKKNNDFWENGTIPWFRMEDIRTNGRLLDDAIQHVTVNAVNGRKLISKNSIILSTTATIGEHALIKVDALTNQQITSYTLKASFKNKLGIMFAFYYFFIYGEWCKKNANQSGGMAIISLKQLKKFKIPLPPLPVQQEIVRILDNFTELTAELTTELTAELTARKKQYEYYRNYLLTLSNDVPRVSLIDISDISRGIRVVKKQLKPDAIYPVYQNSLAPMGYYDKYNYKANTTYVISAGAAGEIGFCDKDFWAADDCLVFSNLIGVINKYIYYFLMTKQDFIRSSVRKASIPRLSRVVIEDLKIPLPSLDEQACIVSILDRFDTLCNDLTSGIPAEIEARQKQYEYYRDKLLTFKEKKA